MDMVRLLRHVRSVLILLKKHFRADERKLPEPLTGFAPSDVNNHIAFPKIDKTPSCWCYGRLQIKRA
jgi:hypothetical protein